jgi:hypothetical protein
MRLRFCEMTKEIGLDLRFGVNAFAEETSSSSLG